MDGKSNTMNQLLEGIEKEKEQRFKKTWSKLDKGSKLNRIHLFIKAETEDKDLNNSQEKELKNLLLRIFESGGLNKASEVEYSQETFEISSLKNLIFNKETNKYDFVSQIKKKKVGGNKSKTNVERHFSRSKERKNKNQN